MQPLRLGLVGGIVAATGLGIAAPAVAVESSAARNSSVYVVHGIPGQPVDVYVNGEKTLTDFAPAKVAGPLDLPAGSYDIVLTKPGEDPESAPLLEVDDAEVPGGANLSLVAHLNADGEPTLTPFVNDVSKVAAGQARLIVRHTAAAPAVDVRAGGEPVFRDLTNPNEAKADVPAGTLNVDVVLAGTDDVVLGPTDLTLAEGTVTIVYAIGSAEDDTLAITSQVIRGLDSAPDGVPAGTGGLADPGLPTWWYGLLAGSVLVLLAGIALGVSRRTMSRL
ncbi:MAG TPA: DUF4397 domain-containing protein [Micromonosporaceae bacterium]